MLRNRQPQLLFPGFRVDGVRQSEFLSHSRLLPFGVIHFMSYSTYTVIDDFAQSVRDAERLVLRQRMPGGEGKIFAKCVLLGRIESLRWNTDSGHLVERSLCFRPLDSGVLDIHTVGSSGLYQELHAGITVLQGVAKCIAQIIMGGMFWDWIGSTRACS